MTDLRHRLEYLVFRIIVCVVQMLPFRTSVRVCELLGTGVSKLPKKWNRHKVANENLIRAFGDEYTQAERDEIIRKMWVHLFRMVVEIVQFPRKIRLYNANDVVSYRYRNAAAKTLGAGRPVLMVSGHFGNWELSLVTLGLYGYPFGVVARDLDNPYLHRWFERYREATGHRLISKRGAAEVMPDWAEARGNLALLGDQDAGKKGLFVDFFGVPASTFKSIALLAMQYRAVISVGWARRLPDDFENNRWIKFEMGTEDVIDPDDFTEADAVKQITARYTEALERAIRRSPEQYFWVHRRWKSEPRAKKKRSGVPQADAKAA